MQYGFNKNHSKHDLEGKGLVIETNARSWYSGILAVTMLGFAIVNGCITFPINSDRWIVENANKSIQVPATVPGGVYTDLSKAGVLPEDVFYRLNDQQYRWVAHDNWTYYTVFDVTDPIFAKTYVYLTFHGLDTIASVYFNEQFLGNTNNMFVRYRFDVRKLLQKHGNKITVRFTSPILAAMSYAKADKYEVPPKCVNKEINGECHVNYLRKMQASFGWDWGPAFPSVGIWKSVTLEGYNNAFARSISVTTNSSGDNWNVSAIFYLELPEQVENATIVLELMDNGTKIFEIIHNNVYMKPNNDLEGEHIFNFNISKKEIKTWWPNGLGDQPLYYMKLIFRKPEEDTDAGIMIGFRTIELVQENVVKGDKEKGLSFYFKVNDVPFFAKGSNFIPVSILPERSTNFTVVENLLHTVKETNMNMVRVWGGGLYESDYFYYLTDMLGILVWQDMAFACSLYPANDEFLSNVGVEIKQQVRRLQSHPSLAVWTANNENEGALRNNWYNTNKNYSLFEKDYINLYVNTVKPNVINQDTSRPFLLSSPSNGRKTEDDGGVTKNPSSSLYGDVHFYNYYDNLWMTDALPSTRFASEYGIMSMPSMEALENAVYKSELMLDSQVIQSRQHHLGGYSQLLIEIAHNLLPIISSNMDTFVYFTQINQAMGIKTQTENYRRLRNILNDKGEGLTMGALYWQLNDVWQAPSWSSIDFHGKWKMLHYFAKDFFHPILVSPSLTSDDKFALSLISDKLHVVNKVKVTMYVYNWCCLYPLYKKNIVVNMKPSHVTEIFQKDITSVLQKGHKCGNKNMAKKRCFLYFETEKNKVKVGPDNFLFPSPLHSVVGMKNATIKVTNVKRNVDSRNGSRVDITISTNAVAAFVWLDVINIPGHFSNNGFILVNKVKTVTFQGDTSVDIEDFKNVLTIKSLGSVSR